MTEDRMISGVDDDFVADRRADLDPTADEALDAARDTQQ